MTTNYRGYAERMFPLTTNHWGDYTKDELLAMDPGKLIEIIMGIQMDDNFILMSDSYKQGHHVMYPKGLREVSSYLEARGGWMEYIVFIGLQPLLKKYMVGVRITPEKIEEAREMCNAHFGFDCFNDTMWKYIIERHGGKLPLEIKAVPEGTRVAVKNCLMTIRNTDKDIEWNGERGLAAPLVNHAETLLLKVWGPCTVASYASKVFEMMIEYWRRTSTTPIEVLRFLHHCFGYRGTSSEESARILGAAGLSIFNGTDTMGALKFINRYYNPTSIPGVSVFASEHSVMCSYGGPDQEPETYRKIISEIRALYPDAWVISLVSDTYNVMRVCRNILPEIKDLWVGQFTPSGMPVKVVVRFDSGEAKRVLFGLDTVLDPSDIENNNKYLAEMLSRDDRPTAERDWSIGGFGVLAEEFGHTTNDKGFRVLNPHIGCLQGDGVGYKAIRVLYDRMELDMWDITNLVLGSGGKYLQAHDRDENKWAIKATHVIIHEVEMDIQKNPITDPGKKSKYGYLKTVKNITPPASVMDGNWDPSNWVQDSNGFKTIQSWEEGYEEAVDHMRVVFLNGDLIVDQDWDSVRANADLIAHYRELEPEKIS